MGKNRTRIQKALQRSWPREPSFFLENSLNSSNYVTIHLKSNVIIIFKAFYSFKSPFTFIITDLFILKLMFSNLERCQSINRGGMEVAHVHASLMSPSAMNMSVPVGGSTPFNGSAYYLSVTTVPNVRPGRCFYPRKGVQGDSAQRPMVQHLFFNCQIFECLICARDCFQFWGCSSEQNRHPQNSLL